MRRPASTFVICLLLAPALLLAQGDFTGTWNITAQYSVDPETMGTFAESITCHYSGTASIIGVSGPVNLGTVPMGNPDFCESSLTGVATVKTSNGTIEGTILDRALGDAFFSGTAGGTALVTSGAKAATSITGTVSAGQTGPLTGALNGQFMAVLMVPAPSLPPAALGLLLFLVVASGGYFFLRGREQHS